MAATLLKVTAQVGIPLGAVYYTATNDIWTTESAKTHKTVTQFKDLVFTDTKLEKEPITRLSNWAASNYNAAVKTVFTGVSQTPEVAVTISNDATTYIKNQLTDSGAKS